MQQNYTFENTFVIDTDQVFARGNFDLDQVLLNNHERSLSDSYEALKNLLFSKNVEPISANFIAQIVQSGVSVFSIHRNNFIAAYDSEAALLPLELNFTLLPGSWNNSLLPKYIHNQVVTDEKLVLLPLVGKIFHQGQEISIASKTALGIKKLQEVLGTSEEVPSRFVGFLSKDNNILIPGHFPLFYQKNAEQRYQLIEDPVRSQKFLENLEGSISQGVSVKAALALEYEGLGIVGYESHYQRSCLIDRADQQVLQNIKIEGQEISKVIDRKYNKQVGIFLDLQKPVSANPLKETLINSADYVSELFELEKKLISAGAILSRITLGVTELFSKETLQPFLKDKAHFQPPVVICRGVMDTTDSLADIMGVPNLVDISIDPKFMRHVQTMYSELNFEQARDLHLIEIFSNLGRNAAVCFRLGLTIDSNMDIADKISAFGKLKNLNFLLNSDRYFERCLLIESFINEVLFTGAVAGIAPKDLILNQAFGVFLLNLFDQDPVPVRKLITELVHQQDADIKAICFSVILEKFKHDLEQSQFGFYLNALEDLSRKSSIIGNILCAKSEIIKHFIEQKKNGQVINATQVNRITGERLPMTEGEINSNITSTLTRGYIALQIYKYLPSYIRAVPDSDNAKILTEIENIPDLEPQALSKILGKKKVEVQSPKKRKKRK